MPTRQGEAAFGWKMVAGSSIARSTAGATTHHISIPSHLQLVGDAVGFGYYVLVAVQNGSNGEQERLITKCIMVPAILAIPHYVTRAMLFVAAVLLVADSNLAPIYHLYCHLNIALYSHTSSPPFNLIPA